MTELDTNDKYKFPGTAYNAGNYTLLCVNTACIPFFRLFFSEMQEVSKWSSRDDWWRGYQAFAEMEEMLMSGCVDALIEGQNRIYRLLDTALNGRVYTAITDPVTHITTVTPDQPVVPDPGVGDAPGLRRQLLDMQGILPSGWPFGWGDKPATLADIVRSVRTGPDDAQMLNNALDLLSGADSAVSIFTNVRSLLTDSASVAADGAMLGVLIGSTMANAAMMGLQAKQLDDLIAKIDRLVSSIDGGAEPQPTDNVLETLKSVETLLS